MLDMLAPHDYNKPETFDMERVVRREHGMIQREYQRCRNTTHCTLDRPCCKASEIKKATSDIRQRGKIIKLYPPTFPLCDVLRVHSVRSLNDTVS